MPDFATALPRGPVLLVTVWVCLIAGVLLYAWLFEGRLGEKARLLREAPLVAATLGIDGAAWRFAAFVVGGALAGLAGACSAALSGVVSPEATGFSIMVLCLTLVVLGGARHPMGAVVGAALAVGLPELLRDLQGAWLLAYAVATLAVVLWAPEGLAGLIDRLLGTRRPLPVAPGLPPVVLPVPGPQRLTYRRRRQTLRRRRGAGRCVAAGGSRRDRRPDRTERLGQDDAAQRHQRPRTRRRGTIALDDRRIEHLPAHAVARAGIGRSFQALVLAGDTKSADLARAVATVPPSCCSTSRPPASATMSARRWRRSSQDCATPAAAC